MKGISACTEAALTPSGAGADSSAGEVPPEQLKGFVPRWFGLIYLSVGSVGGPEDIAGRFPVCQEVPGLEELNPLWNPAEVPGSSCWGSAPPGGSAEIVGMFYFQILNM